MDDPHLSSTEADIYRKTIIKDIQTAIAGLAYVYTTPSSTTFPARQFKILRTKYTPYSAPPFNRHWTEPADAKKQYSLAEYFEDGAPPSPPPTPGVFMPPLQCRLVAEGLNLTKLEAEHLNWFLDDYRYQPYDEREFELAGSIFEGCAIQEGQ